MYIYYVSPFYKVKSLHKVKVAGSIYKRNKKDYYCGVLLGHKVYYTFISNGENSTRHLDTSYGPFDFFMTYKVQGMYRYLTRVIIESEQPDFASLVIDFANALVNVCNYHYIPVGDYHIVILVLYYSIEDRQQGAKKRRNRKGSNIDNNTFFCVALLYYKVILICKKIFHGTNTSNFIDINIRKVICYYITEFILPGVVRPVEEDVNLEDYTCECRSPFYNSPNTLPLHSSIPSVDLYALPFQNMLNITCTIYHKDGVLRRFIGSEQIIKNTDKAQDSTLYQKYKSNKKCLNIHLEPVKAKVTKTVEVKYYFNSLISKYGNVLYEVVAFAENFYVLFFYKINTQNNCYAITEYKVIEKYLNLKSKVSSYDWKLAGDMNLVLNQVKPYFVIDINKGEILEPDKVFEPKRVYYYEKPRRKVVYRVGKIFIFNKKTHVEVISLSREREILRIETRGDYGKMFLDALHYNIQNPHLLPISLWRNGQKFIFLLAGGNNRLIAFMCENSIIYNAVVLEGNYTESFITGNALFIRTNSGQRHFFYLLDFDGIIYKTDYTWLMNLRNDFYRLYTCHFYENYLFICVEFCSDSRLLYALFIDFTDRYNVKVMQGKVFHSLGHIFSFSPLHGTVLVLDCISKKIIRLYGDIKNLRRDYEERKILFTNTGSNNPKYQVSVNYRIKEGLFVVTFNEMITRFVKVL